MKFTLLTAALVLAGYATAVPMVKTSSFDDGYVAPLYAPVEAEAVRGSYIVVLKDHLSMEQLQDHAEWISSMVAAKAYNNGEFLDSSFQMGIKHVYETPNFKGYAGRFDKNMLEAIRRSEEVDFVEEDSIVYASELQRGAPWGLARISSRKALTLRNFSKYNYDANTAGDGVKVYVIDTGINVSHNDFGGRATWGKTIPAGDDDRDGNGHGSHCAGTIAGTKYGVAKKARPVAVKVLASNGSGSMSDVMGGVDWAILDFRKDKEQAQTEGKSFKGAVANMSLGGGKSVGLDKIVNAAVDAGMVFAVAAGNDNRDACDYSPARAEKAITVGASTIADERAYFSNYGKCVDVFAPGLDIQSIWIGSNTATNTISGTSMASPHVAGLAAYFLSQSEPGVTPKEIKERILAVATPNELKKIPKDTPNLLIYNDYESS
ncbi:Putative Cerevisin [Rhizopus microsporus]|nr:Putative Cerevisin [Rhizopus microsporus]